MTFEVKYYLLRRNRTHNVNISRNINYKQLVFKSKGDLMWPFWHFMWYVEELFNKYCNMILKFLKDIAIVTSEKYY